MTDQEKLNVMHEFVTECHLENYGGYPHDSMWVGDKLVVADLDPGKDRHRTMLITYTKQKLLDWFDDATELKTGLDDTKMDFRHCLFETWP